MVSGFRVIEFVLVVVHWVAKGFQKRISRCCFEGAMRRRRRFVWTEHGAESIGRVEELSQASKDQLLLALRLVDPLDGVLCLMDFFAVDTGGDISML